MNTVQMSSFSDELYKIATGALGHATEIAGLGILAKPSIDKLRGKKVDERSAAKKEVAGLGVLAAPSAVGLASGTKWGKRVGETVKNFAGKFKKAALGEFAGAAFKGSKNMTRSLKGTIAATGPGVKTLKKPGALIRGMPMTGEPRGGLSARSTPRLAQTG